MTSSVISFAYFTPFLTRISPELMQVFANGRQHFHSRVLFDTPKKSTGKNLIIVALLAPYSFNPRPPTTQLSAVTDVAALVE